MFWTVEVGVLFCAWGRDVDMGLLGTKVSFGMTMAGLETWYYVVYLPT